MDLLVYMAISIGVLSGVWAWMAVTFGMVTWVGFVGWTSYYSSGGMAKGLLRSLTSNVTGIIYAIIIIKGISIFPNEYWGYFLTAFFSFIMVIQSKFRRFEFISGAFCGCFSTFGLNGDWMAVGIALLCGNILGYISQKIGIYSHKVLNKD